MKSWCIGLTALFFVTTTHAEEAAKGPDPALAAAVRAARVPLVKGLEVAAKQGRPISAKFEMADGALQLSVYTTQGEKFFEVIVDHQSGKIAKTEPITGGDDLQAAQQQAAATAKAKRSLQDAVRSAQQANPKATVVSVTPAGSSAGAHAAVVLLAGGDAKTVTERL